MRTLLLIVLLSFGTQNKTIAQQAPISPDILAEFVAYLEKHSLSVDAYLANTKDLSVFLKTLKLTDQLETLNTEGKEYITIFAPTNEAFDQFPTDVIKELFSAENKSKLEAIITYHLIEGKITASDIVRKIDESGGKEAVFMTNNGLPITTYYDEEDLFIKDDNGYSIKIAQEDILLSNGVVYKINTVILPQVDNEFEKEGRR